MRGRWEARRLSGSPSCFGAAWFALASAVFFSLCAGAGGQENEAGGAPGARVPVAVWSDASRKPRAALLCLHGLGLHKGTYEAFGKRMASEGLVTYAMDLRGFGDWKDSGKREEIDFPGSLSDIKAVLESIHSEHPDLPVLLLGESMGGAVALHAAAIYGDQVAGLISSVPSGDRFKSGSEKLRVALHALSEGFNTPMPLESVVEQATQKPELRTAWMTDPQARLKLSPNELIKFQHFMDANPAFAEKITTTPVLFVAGCNDKLVRPAGTWDLFDFLKTPNRDRVYSAHAEHLIFEEAQFNEDDIKYLLSWIDKYVPAKPVAPLVAHPQEKENAPETMAMDYWLELYRAGKNYRCNNKTEFLSGDGIRFHFVPHADGYAYILLTSGTKGDRAVLFPSEDAGLDNYLHAGRDYILPSKAWLWFDEQPGTEKVSLIFSRTAIDASAYLDKRQTEVAYVSPDRSGAKDLVPTRMELSWDDPAPVIMPGGREQLAGGSTVRVRQRDRGSTIALEIALEHR